MVWGIFESNESSSTPREMVFFAWTYPFHAWEHGQNIIQCDVRHMHIGPSSVGMHYIQQPDVPNQGEDNYLPPPSIKDKSRRGGRSLMEGWWMGWGGFQQPEDEVDRTKGTFGTESTSILVTGTTTGNTLPQYLSNLSMSLSNLQFAHRLSTAVAMTPFRHPLSNRAPGPLH